MELWTEKYRPKNLKELGGDGELVRVLQRFFKEAFAELESVKKINKQIRAQNRNLPKSKRKKEKTPNPYKVAIVLRGSHGIGKTTTVLAIAKEMNIPVSESNASDARTIAKIKEVITPATRYKDVTSFFTPMIPTQIQKIVLIDEVDGISGKSERGGAGEILKTINETLYPIVLIENEWKKSLSKIYNSCQVYEVKRASDDDVFKVLQKINEKEKLSLSLNDLKRISESVQGDYRAAITDVQNSASSNRDQLQTIFEATDNFFKANTPEQSEEVLRNVPVPLQDFYLWVFENLTEGTHHNTLPLAYRLISEADSIMGKILEFHEWSMYPQFIEILRALSTITKKLDGRVQQPKWFTQKKRILEDLMNEYFIGREEAVILDALQSELNK